MNTSRRFRVCALCFAATIFTICLPLTIAQPNGLNEQTQFSAEDDEVQHPVALPETVKVLLGQLDMVQLQLKDAGLQVSQLPDSWFSASFIHLRTAEGQPDLIVQAEGPLVGANVDTFWVFVASKNGYKLALTIPAHNLNILRVRRNGYRVVEVAAMTCCTVASARYRFNGATYEKYEEKTEEIR